MCDGCSQCAHLECLSEELSLFLAQDENAPYFCESCVKDDEARVKEASSTKSIIVGEKRKRSYKKKPVNQSVEVFFSYDFSNSVTFLLKIFLFMHTSLNLFLYII